MKDKKSVGDSNKKEVCELYLCESKSLYLKADTLYIFKVDKQCKRCVELDIASRIEFSRKD
jgi:hypothetical protein